MHWIVWACIIALVLLGSADMATAMRVCAPPMDVGPVEACTIVIE